MRVSPNHLAVIIATFLLASPIALYAQSPQKPPVPTLTPNHTERSVKISWTSTFQSERISSWEVWAWTEQDNWRRVDSGNLTATSIKDTGLQVGIKHWYTYRANFSDGTSSEWSDYSSVTLSDGRPPPPIIQARMDGEAIVISWSEVPGATHYALSCWCGFDRWDGLGDSYKRTETTFLPAAGWTYYFSVQARNDSGELTRWSDNTMIKVPEVLATRTPTPSPTATPTATPIPNSAYAKWVPGITIAPENNCSWYQWEDYGFNQTTAQSKELREKIVASMGGIYYDPYLGQYFGGFSEMRINHVVDIWEGHISGMCHPSRSQYANSFVYDLENAVLTSLRLTGHSDAYDLAEWLPDFNRCWYVNQVVHVKRKYGLTMDKDEADVAVVVLSGCSSTDMVLSASPTPTPTTVTNDPLQMYDDNGDGRISCEEARRHGIAPVYRVHPAYQYMDDPDNNGIACE